MKEKERSDQGPFRFRRPLRHGERPGRAAVGASAASPAQLDLKKIRKGGLKAQVFAIWVDPLFAPQRALKKGLQVLQAMEQKVFAPKLANKVDQRGRNGRRGPRRAAGRPGFSWKAAISSRTPRRSWPSSTRLGVRGMTLTHSQNTDWADSATDTPRAKGLTPLGRRIVAQMERTGMAIDVSHASDATIEAVPGRGRRPDHGLPFQRPEPVRRAAQPARPPDPRHRRPPRLHRRQFFPGLRPRRVSEQIDANFKKFAREIRAKTKGQPRRPRLFEPGGMGVLPARRRRRRPGRPGRGDRPYPAYRRPRAASTASAWAATSTASPARPVGLADVAAFPALVAALQKRGFREAEIRKICGLNLRNFLRRVERKGGGA